MGDILFTNFPLLRVKELLFVYARCIYRRCSKFFTQKILAGSNLCDDASLFFELSDFSVSQNVGELGAATWTILLSFWIQIYFFSMIALMARLHFGAFNRTGEFLFGKAKCPGCNEIYSRPLFGFNLGSKRYERCPKCRKFHLLSTANYVIDTPSQVED